MPLSSKGNFTKCGGGGGGGGGGGREGEVTSIPDHVHALGTRISFSVNRLLGL